MKFHFPKAERPHQICPEDWQNPWWHLRQGPKTAEQFAKYLSLTPSEKAALSTNASINQFAVRATPYYLSLIDKSDDNDPIRRIAVPQADEFTFEGEHHADPLGENKNSPTSRIVHRYPDRVLFLVTDLCSVYCRYCTRKHFTGQDQSLPKADEYNQALRYIQTHPGIREVILSGGDPLTLGDAHLQRILSDLRKIEHIEIIRIGSRMPVVCPMRITPELIQIIRSYQPVFLMAHFNHPKEITEEAAQALARFVDNGIPVMNQMVLLNGVNNHPAIVQALSRRLLYLRVKPYYMFQCDPSRGTEHLRTSIEESLQIQKELWGNLSGLAMASVSLDIPDGGGKAGLVPNFEVARSADSRTYRGWDGVQATYKNPAPQWHQLPSDYQNYLSEWNTLKNAKNDRPPELYQGNSRPR